MMYGGTRRNRWDELDMRRLLARGGEEGWCRRKWMLYERSSGRGGGMFGREGRKRAGKKGVE